MIFEALLIRLLSSEILKIPEFNQSDSSHFDDLNKNILVITYAAFGKVKLCTTILIGFILFGDPLQIYQVTTTTYDHMIWSIMDPLILVISNLLH